VAPRVSSFLLSKVVRIVEVSVLNDTERETINEGIRKDVSVTGAACVRTREAKKKARVLSSRRGKSFYRVELTYSYRGELAGWGISWERGRGGDLGVGGQAHPEKTLSASGGKRFY